ncbi:MULTISPECIES: glycosyltransferase [Fischerella]|uniref:Glycosyl transferase family 2 n=1 Tax=Fischerella muscicola CCMEE 5323 TaxID=2019572 RepID=A0A2N6JVH2_FISMU|nr:MULTISPECIES: glycosyltransferase [Fischerella]MBD2434435.1 glycosyltransferase [Fischerella sp. FACHB-380]PLZ83359.1 glycosyl transferase family 2 [Fischerella muscicola CCMEE 5323]
MEKIELAIVIVSLLIWIALLTLWGQFWQTDQQLEVTETHLEKLPSVCVVIPARNEADLLPKTLRSLLCQNYPGSFTIFLVDDHSTDGTAEVAQQTAQALNKDQQLHLITAQALPPGWSGKLWAMEQGINKATTILEPDYLLLTDADIEHDPVNLHQLVAKAEQENLDLVSLMVRLRCENFWEKLLIPAFVFFFQKLYPFRWVNDPQKSTAAAAGGCILIRTAALKRIGGLQVIRQALIDDCALAHAIKSVKSSSPPSPHHSTSPKIWLGLSSSTHSLRPYPSLSPIWDMIARTAFTQLNYSPLLLIGTLVGMILVYIVPPLGLIVGTLTGNWLVALTGLSAWLLMSLAYLPMVRFYQCPLWLAFCLPIIAFLYTLMTLDSALRYWQGRGGGWKGRVYKAEGRG